MVIDLQKVEAGIQQVLDAQKSSLDSKGADGVLARLQTEVLPPLMRWKAGEMNRDSVANDVLNALVYLVAPQIVALARDVVPPGNPNLLYAQVNKLLMGIGEAAGDILSGAHDEAMVSQTIATETAH